MSYCRFGEADVYVFGSGDSQWTCCACSLNPDIDNIEALIPYHDTYCDTLQELKKHLEKHIKEGHYIPGYVFERINKEIEEAKDEKAD